MDVLPLALGIAGFVILYGAVRNLRPDDVVKLALQGKDVKGARPIAAPLVRSTMPGTVPGTAIPGTPEKDADARTDPPGFDPKRDSVIPILPGEAQPQQGGGVL